MKCTQCGAEFVFSAGEQEFFRAKGFTHQPKTCRLCRSKKTQSHARADIPVKCADCGTATTVPFTPRHHRPVYCRACFSEHRSLQTV
ncbi:zinc-ribbon domain containing protein [Occallatibacter savannae]|uniref:zinc-ribbon domain containing protein n=1 Tax=Occallatibacter savannae TaxID=1002691 RepID=UPI001EF3E8B7|nr:zinc-ribbon domain containing protein [Occallatibacter savannae]